MEGAAVATSTTQRGETFVIPGPISVFSQAYYKNGKGQTIAVPVEVSGEKITLTVTQVPPPQS